MTYKALALVAVRLNTKRLKKKALLNLYNKPPNTPFNRKIKNFKKYFRYCLVYITGEN